MRLHKEELCSATGTAPKMLVIPSLTECNLVCSQSYAEKGLRILAFPCNQFGGQEPGTEREIKEFVSTYGVEFDMFGKIDVNGSNADPLYVFLKNAKHGTLTNNIKWNFTKFLCDRHGVPVKRYSPTTSPLDIVKDIEKELLKE
ncbi:hypothetical protein pdam_00000923 [Pocillopora damicornis]|uniref:Glutathione peroxidase n=1 Tax=Pocillopora damicornis TaxID=46731 RepID=A0A3M6T6E4_POCDA|nr:hypothetical protein pdam_00000923 [Pocillopora damicornis]